MNTNSPARVARLVRTLVNKLQGKTREAFCPIDHPPADEVQIDWDHSHPSCSQSDETKVMIFCAQAGHSNFAPPLRAAPPRVLDAIEKFGQVHIDTMSVSRADMSLDLFDGSVC